MPKKKKVVTEATKEAKKDKLDKEKWCVAVRATLLEEFIVELRTLDSVTHEQIEQLIAKYGI